MARTTKTPSKKTGSAKAGSKSSTASVPGPVGVTAVTRRADPAGASAVTPGSPRATAAAPSSTAIPKVTETPVPQPVVPVDTPTAADPAAVRAEATSTAQPTKGPGFFPLLLGGLLAGVIGFLVATFLTGDSGQGGEDTARVDALAAEVETLREAAPEAVDLSLVEAAQLDFLARLEVLSERVEELEAAEGRVLAAEGDRPADTRPDPALGAAVEALRADVDALRENADTLSGNFATLETEVTTLNDEFGPRVAGLEDELAAANARSDTVEADAEALARQAARNQVRQALQSGAPYAEPLAVLGGDAPESLSAPAETGIPSQAALIAAFPDLSRQALRAARTDAPAGVGSLFQNAFNPRSLAPKEGNDPDAVLSRAEAAVRDGDLSTAVTEIEALPDAAKTVLDPWTERANARAAALAAADDYLQDG